MSRAIQEFRPVGPGWMIHTEYVDPDLGVDDPVPLVGWTWFADAWVPTFWHEESKQLMVADPDDTRYSIVRVTPG